jgi:hypothetical protein|nr:MAG TPA: hypothetical protein [Caudoviricetes sp.]
MENLLNVGDKLTIPKGCKAVIKDNQIVIEEKFKDGDILRSNLTDNAFIFKSYDDESFETFSIYYGNNYKSAWNTLNFRHATEEEKQNFFDELKEKGLQWNPETKQMDKIKIRVQFGKKYLTINEFGEVVEIVDERYNFDDKKYNSGNYYLLSERKEAEEDAKVINAIYEKRVKVK